MFTIIFSNVMIAVKIRRSRIFVRPVAIAKRLEKVVYSFLLNAKNVVLRNYSTQIIAIDTFKCDRQSCRVR
jgi:hypothetical protein